jgi:hypothetical protein
MDPTLIFLSKIGPPDSAELAAEASRNESALDENDDENENDLDNDDATSVSTVTVKEKDKDEETRDKDDASVVSGSSMKWPAPADLNTRLRRLVTCYQRSYKREEQKMALKAKVSCAKMGLLFFEFAWFNSSYELPCAFCFAAFGIFFVALEF